MAEQLADLNKQQKEEFFTSMLPYAKKASGLLGIPSSVILSQWAYESYYGSSNLAKNTGNFAGIKHVGKSIDSGSYGSLGYADYKLNKDQFVQDYVRVFNNGYYEAVKKADTVENTIKALVASPWAESGYSGGKGLLDIIAGFGLKKYDNADNVNVVSDTVSKTFSVEVPANANNKIIGMAIIGVGVAMLASLIKD